MSKYKKQIILFLLIIELFSLCLTFTAFSNKKVSKVKEVNKIDKEMFSMYVQNKETGEYEEAEFFPSGNYKINQTKSVCVDNKGNSVSNDVMSYSSEGKLTVSSNKTIYCYLYFDIKADFVIDVSTDGVAGSLPTTGGYKNTLSCNDSTYSWNGKYQRIEFSSVSTDEVKCNLDYIKDTETHTSLISEVQSKATTNANGYRYSGKTPNNWIWFNNELWRIIGSIPTCTSSGCETQENLVKIIRADAIGRFPYSNHTGQSGTTAREKSTWGKNVLYTQLNSYYYSNDVNHMDATNSGYCYTQYSSSGDSTQRLQSCDYRDIGILSTSYYGRMVKNVYWNTGYYSATTASGAYTNETATQTVSGYVGIMSPSDYGYAASSSYHSTSLSSYNSTISTNWLFSGEREWIIAPQDSNTGGVYYIIRVGLIDRGYSPTNGFLIRPVVYLDSSVYLVSGSGTFSDPYIVGM